VSENPAGAHGIPADPLPQTSATPGGCSDTSAETDRPDQRLSVVQQETKMPDDKMKSENAVPQADKQAHTEMAEREGRDGAQAQSINKEKAEKNKKG
jgi:hypothetical protein